MKKGRFLWSAHRITKKQKAGKARNIKEKQLKNSRNTVSRQHVEHRSSASDNFLETRISRKARFTRVTEVVGSCKMGWKLLRMQHTCNRNATNISMICIGHFQRNLGMSFLRVTTSGAFVDEYWMGVLALTDIYSAANIARQRDMSKITK